MQPIPWERVQRLLAIAPDDDVLALAPALRTLRQATPQIDTLLLTTSHGARLAGLLRWDGGVLAWDGTVDPMAVGGDEREWDESTRELVDALRTGAFDAAVIFAQSAHAPHVWRYIAHLAGIEHRAGPGVEHTPGTPRSTVPERRHLELLLAAGLPVAVESRAESQPAQRRQLAAS